MKRLLTVSVLLVALLAVANAQSLTDISEAKTACLVNRGTDLKTMDDVREKLQQWGRWKLVAHPEDADLLLVLSNQEVVAGSVGTASGYATASGHYASGSSTGIAAPIVLAKIFLAAVDRQSGDIFTFVTATRRRHLIAGDTAYLVNSLKAQIEKHEHRAGR